jgi:hypothetical protein
LTAGTNIVLAKGTGITGFNDLSAAQVNAEVDTGLADVGLTTTVTGRIDTAITTRLATGGTVALAAGGLNAVLVCGLPLPTAVEKLMDKNVGDITKLGTNLHRYKATGSAGNGVDIQGIADGRTVDLDPEA